MGRDCRPGLMLAIIIADAVFIICPDTPAIRERIEGFKPDRIFIDDELGTATKGFLGKSRQYENGQPHGGEYGSRKYPLFTFTDSFVVAHNLN